MEVLMDIKVIKEDCSCTNDCIRHGNCKTCKAHHADKEYTVACE